MKRRFVVLICFVLCSVLCLCSCQGETETSNTTTTDTAENTTCYDHNCTTSTTVESTTTTTEETTKNSSNTTIINLDDFVGKTLGELEENGYEYSGYMSFGSEYTFDYRTETRIYEVKVDVPEEIEKALDDLDFFDDDREEKEKAIRSILVIKSIKVVNAEPISEIELSKYVGKKASVLITDGFKISGFFGYNGEYTFFFTKDRQGYSVELDEVANTILNEREFGDDSYKTKVLDSIVTKIEYDSPY